MMEQIDIFTRQLLVSAQSSSPVNVAERIKFMSLDVVGHLVFGYPLNLQTNEANRHMIGTLKGGNYRLNTYMQYLLLAKLHLEIFVFVLMLIKKESYLRLLEKMIESRLAEEKHAKHDLYSIMVDAMEGSDSEGIKLSEIWSEALFFFPAGGESVTTAISALFFYLSQNPQVYQELAEEIRSTFKTSDEIHGGPQLAGCQYLRACIDETLRMAPPGPGTMWRERSSKDDRSRPFLIDGDVIPEGTIFGVNIYTLHHNEEYFPDPFSFKPERWLPSRTPEAQRKVMHNAFAAFLLGPRGCGGKAMAYLEISLVVAKTLWYFDFERAPGAPGDLGGGTGSAQETNGRERRDEYQLYDIFAAAHDGPNLIFTPRGDTIGQLRPQ
ncbi:hypothetical protein DL766_007916 [Monosporascus sp. MC13-8B]|nr:hypothetical protein DL766_007916 [Monosporascus sp. MC13-8B]